MSKKQPSHSHSHPGIHHGRVLPSDMDWWTVEIRGPDRDPTAQQPDGQQDLDTGHLFPEWQEVDLSQHDHPQQAVPHHAERNYPLHHEVNSAGQWAPNPAKTRIEQRPGKQLKHTDIQEYAQTWKEMRSATSKNKICAIWYRKQAWKAIQTNMTPALSQNEICSMKINALRNWWPQNRFLKNI